MVDSETEGEEREKRTEKGDSLKEEDEDDDTLSLTDWVQFQVFQSTFIISEFTS